jgi:delta 1-pyrroline-5-carboxylate dehydrogenase
MQIWPWWKNEPVAPAEAARSTSAPGSTIATLLPPSSVHDEYVDRLVARAEALAVGDPSTEQVHLGPIIDEKTRPACPA